MKSLMLVSMLPIIVSEGEVASDTSASAVPQNCIFSSLSSSDDESSPDGVVAAAANLTVESINEDVDLADNEPPSTFGQQERDATAGNEVDEATTSESKNGNDVLDQEQVLGHAVHPAKDPEMDAGNWFNSLF